MRVFISGKEYQIYWGQEWVMTVISMELSFLNLCSSTFSRPLRTSFFFFLSQACSEWKINNIHQLGVIINKASDLYELSSWRRKQQHFSPFTMFTEQMPSIYKAVWIRSAIFAWYAACNYLESHWLISHPAWPDSPQIVYTDTQAPIGF